MQKTRIAIGVPTFKRPLGLRRALQSVAGLRIGEDLDVRVIVSENDLEGRQGVALVEDTVAAGYRFPLESVLSSGRGISQARNALVARAFADPETQMLVMLDDDQWATEDWLTELVAMQRQTGAHIVGGVAPPDFQGAPESWVLHLSPFRRPQQKDGIVPMINGTYGVLLHRSLLPLCGGTYFDEDFSLTGGGDKEFFIRMRGKGAVFAYTTKAVCYEVFERDRLTVEWARRRAYRIGSTDMRAQLAHAPGTGFLVKEVAKIGAGFVVAGGRWVIGVGSPLHRTQAELSMMRAAGKLSTLFGMRYDAYRNVSGQ